MYRNPQNEKAYGQEAECFGATSEIAIDSGVGPWVVEYLDPARALRQVFLRRGEKLTIGSRGNVDLRLEDNCVSAVHCELDASGPGLWLVDLDSRNGVYVGGARISRARLERQTLSFTIGRTTVRVRPTTTSIPGNVREAIAGLVGQSEPMVRLGEQIRRLAKLHAPILIVGESGTGKDVVAQALHRLSECTGAYVPLNVATLPDSLADSELFGHCRGAFTGAVQSRVGAFEQAQGGTLFLDEIGELTPPVQAKLLRVLEDGMVRPVGASQARHVDVRIVAATCAPLSERCSNGQFRFDLLQRLSTVVLVVPPLRDRKSDIECLAQAWLDRYRGEVGVRSLTPEAIKRLMAYEWPGNVRELGGAIYRACVGAESSVISEYDVEQALRSQVGGVARRRSDPLELLTLAEGNVSHAARLAGLPRTTFRTWLARARHATEGADVESCAKLSSPPR